MSYTGKLNCKRKKCGDKPTVPLKLVVKGDKVIDVARCPTCHEGYKILLPLKDKSQWIPLMKPLFSCDVCGTAIENWQVIGGDYMLYHAELLKIIMQCKSKKCGIRRAKIVSRVLWPDLMALMKKPPEAPPPPPEFKCPNCNEAIPADAKVCPNCKIEVVCDKCGTPVLPGSKFCVKCGDPVEKIEIPIAAEGPQEGVCPSCEAENEEGSNFCGICGQELKCDKCGTPIREGAKFCNECGDPVKQGKLSE